MKARELGKIKKQINVKTHRKISKKINLNKKITFIMKDVKIKEVKMICKIIKYKT